MLSIGVASPESRVNGMAVRNIPIIACCIVFDSAEIHSPAPTAARMNVTSPR